MALQGSGAISLANLQTEFGGANPISMSEYYRGGSYTTSNNTNVPTSGAISLSNFYGATAFVPDYVPNAFNINDVYDNAAAYSQASAQGSTNTVTISGINTAITLTISGANFYAYGSGESGGTTFAGFDVTIIKNGSDAGVLSTFSGSTPTPVSIAVNNGDTLSFFYSGSVTDQLEMRASGNAGGTVTIKNASSGNTTLDTIQFDLILSSY